MPLDVTCPRCQRVFPVTEARAAVAIECPRCDAELTAEFRPASRRAPAAARVRSGYPASQAAYAGLATRRKTAATRRRERQIKSGSMFGVMLASLAVLLVSISGLGATGYYLFTARPGTHADALPVPRTSLTAGIGDAPEPGSSVPPPPRVEKFDLNPLAGPVPQITPSKVEADLTTLDLAPHGGRVGAVAVGGGGRFLVLHFPDAGRLGVFDASEGRVVGTVGAEKGDVKVAAGLSWVVTCAAGNTFRVLTLPALEPRYDTTVPLFGGVSAMAMGHRTDGPLLVTNPFGDVVLLDVTGAALKEVEGSRKKPGIVPNNLRAAPDGTAFLTFAHSFEPPVTRSAKVLTEAGRDWAVTAVDAAVTTPGPDGLFYGNWASPVDRTGAAVPLKATYTVPVGRLWFLPQVTRSGDLPLTQDGYVLRVMAFMRYVPVPRVQPVPPPNDQVGPEGAKPAPVVGSKAVALDDQSAELASKRVAPAGAQVVKQQPQQPPVARQLKPSLMVSVHAAGNVGQFAANTTVLSGLPEFDGILDPSGAGRADLDQHFYLIPEAKLLVVLSGDRTKLVLKRVNLP
ncbi:hypothetical protein [Gemmata sp.]|uniref:hypothetical protein n=1 Tax=Gemmata sp. TaxID=1914242 RepID=UPI003F705E1C